MTVVDQPLAGHIVVVRSPSAAPASNTNVTVESRRRRRGERSLRGRSSPVVEHTHTAVARRNAPAVLTRSRVVSPDWESTHHHVTLAPAEGPLGGWGACSPPPQRGVADAGLTIGLIAKRTVDIVVALVAIIVLSPVLVLTALVVCLTSAGSPLFAQQRVGRDGQIFRCWKFRSMYRDAEARLRADDELWRAYVANDFKLSSDDDPRVTPTGRWLRRLSLDELPQLFNVLIGEMSLVGPRPVVEDEMACYGLWAGAYMSVRPGLTGPWQVGDGRLRYPERAMLDARYVDTWSFWRDVGIIARTPAALVRRGLAD